MENDQWPWCFNSCSRSLRTTDGIRVLCVGSDGDPGMAPRPQLAVSPGFSLSLLLRGRGQLCSAADQVFQLTPGCVIERWPNQEQDLHFDRAERYAKIYLHLDRDYYMALRQLGLLQSRQPVYRLRETQALQDLLTLMYRKLEQLSDWDADTAMHLLLPLCRFIERNRLYADAHAETADTLAEAAGQLERDLRAQLSMEGLARRCGLNYHSFRRQFRQRFGQSPAQYRQQVRMARACELLSDHQVQEVAEILGFCNAFEFSARFHKVTGMPPSTYQRLA